MLTKYLDGVLPSAARTATVNSDIFSQQGARGAMFFLNVTTAPGGAETLTLEIQIADTAGTGVYQTITDFDPVAPPGAGTAVFVMYPAEAGTYSAGDVQHHAGPLPFRWRARMTHSGPGSWVYALSAQYLT